MLEAFELGDIGERLCSRALNEVVPIKTFLQLLITVMFGVYSHPYLFILSLPMVIWRSKKLFLGYDRCKIANPGETDVYFKHLKLQLAFCWVYLTICLY